MWRYQSCCGCCSLRTGCIILGSVDIAFGLLRLLSGQSILNLIIVLMDVMLIIGAVKKNRIYLVPWMIYQILLNILIWIGAILFLFNPSSIFEEKVDEYDPLLTAVILALIAVAQAFIIKVVVDHFRELGEGGQPGQTQFNVVNSNASQAVMYPGLPPAPANYRG